MTAKVSKKNSFSTLSYQVLWLGSGIRLPRTIPLGPYYLTSKLAEQSLEHIERYARKPVFVRNVQPANFEIKYLVKKLSELLTVKIHSARNVLIRLADLNAILVAIVNQSLP